MRIDDTKPLSAERHPFFGPNEDDWNLDADLDSDDFGKPGVGIVANAISVWSALNGTTTVGDAAKAFKMPPEAVVQCVERHDRSVAERCVGAILDNDIAFDVPPAAVERMVNRVMGAMDLARLSEREWGVAGHLQAKSWVSAQENPIPSDGSPVLICMPLGDGDACYSAAFVNDDGNIESLTGGEITFSATHWCLLSPPTER